MGIISIYIYMDMVNEVLRVNENIMVEEVVLDYILGRGLRDVFFRELIGRVWFKIYSF